MDPMLFYSRRVGRAPRLPLEDHDWSEVPSVTTILGAGKLSGKIGNTSIGILNALTRGEGRPRAGRKPVEADRRAADQLRRGKPQKRLPRRGERRRIPGHERAP